MDWGAEKSLTTLLNLLDYSKYEVDLLLFSQGGAFQSLLPKEVNLLNVPEYFVYNSVPWSNICLKLKSPNKMLAQLRYSIALHTAKYNNIEKTVLLWRASRNCFEMQSVEYDVAIAYAQGLPTFFVAEKVVAKKKVVWINVTYFPKGKYLNFIKPFYEKFNYVNGVSESVVEQMQATFDIPDYKVLMIKDILDCNFATKMSVLPSDVDKEMSGSGIKILTVGRLANMKGYDLAIDAAKLLLNRKIDFTWYAVGEGAIRQELESKIATLGLRKHFILLGSRSNPYPYYKACDIYVQTSRFEGFGITLAEAKMFHKPIVTTNFDAVGSQFTNEKNGLIVDISADAIANGIMRMLTDSKLRNTCVDNVCKEKIDNTEEIEKFYSLFD